MLHPGIKFVKQFTCLSGIAFVLNLVWELLQMPLYATPTNYPWCCIVAAFGDAAIILIIYGIISLTRRNIYWIYRFRSQEVVVSIILGIVIAVVIEVLALSSGRWQYTSAMPIVPFVMLALRPCFK